MAKNQKFPFNVLGRMFRISPYDTKQERDALLLQQIQSNDLELALNEMLIMFGFEEDNDEKVQNLTKNEKLLLFYLYRGISVGDDQQVKYECSNCKKPNSKTLHFDFIDQANEQVIEGIKILDEEVTTENLNEFVTDEYLEKYGLNFKKLDNDLENLDIEVFEKVLQDVKNSQGQLNFYKKIVCSYCEDEKYVDCAELDFALGHVSEQDLILIYEAITLLVTFGYSKEDIDKMLPFERGVLINLMTKHINEKNEQAQQF